MVEDRNFKLRHYQAPRILAVDAEFR